MSPREPVMSKIAPPRTEPTAPPPRRPWRRALAWGAFLGPFFYLTYGGANYFAALRTDVPSIVFAWEHAIPFAGWTIIPYWSINLFYAVSLFVCRDKNELDTHARRLLTAQIIAVACFLAFPLRFTFTQPETGGIPGLLFAALASFDQPYNQAPSLHIALLVILWVLYARHLPFRGRLVLHPWFALVGVSVLTTYQHHFIDIPTGALLGFFCLWLWPDRAASPLAALRWTSDPRRRSLALSYVAGALACAVLAAWLRGPGLWLLWPSVSLLLVALNYALIGPAGFQKDKNGGMSLAAQALYLPYLVGAAINSRLWTRKAPGPVLIADGVFLGRMPFGTEAREFAVIIDLAAELPCGAGTAACHSFPALDLAPPDPATLRTAGAATEFARGLGPVLVCCALGYSRSAAAIATWLLLTGRAADVGEAIDLIRKARPRIVIDTQARAAIEAAVAPNTGL